MILAITPIYHGLLFYYFREFKRNNMKADTRILLYDDYCPLCTWYSGIFVKSGLLKPENRIPFSKADIEILTTIDMEKGKDEIPLFDTKTQTTLYGIDALLEILGQKNS